MWQKIKDWWWTDVHTVWWARFQVALGFIMAVLPTLTPVAWFDAALTPTQRVVLAGTAIANGAWTEYLRRYKATDV